VRILLENISNEQINSKLIELEERIFKLEKTINLNQIKATKKISVREFLIDKKPKGEVQKTLAIGYFLENFNGFSCFNVKDLRMCFKKAKEIVPENINYKIIKNIEKGLLVEYDDKKDGLKAWTLTQTGILFVENNFVREINKLR
jgi:hypothetical protein